MAHRRIAQLTYLLDQRLFHLIGLLQSTLFVTGDLHNGLDAGHQFGTLAELFNQSEFLLTQLRRGRALFLLHPHCI